jgi:hypothetical protein
MSTTPNQQRSIDAIATAFRAQPGEFTLSAPAVISQLDMTILSPNQPLKLTLSNDGHLSEIAFYDAAEENCEADGTITQGRWIDVEQDSAVSGALHAAVAEAFPPVSAAERTPQSLLTALSDQLLDLRDGVSKQRYNVPAEAAYERAATLVRALRDGLPTGPDGGRPKTEEIPDGPETSASDRVAAAELRVMIGLPKLPPIPVDEALVEALAQDFYWMHPELDNRQRAKAFGWASYEARNGHTGNAHRVLTAIVNGEDPYGVPFSAAPLQSRHIQAAEAAIAAWQPKAA